MNGYNTTQLRTEFPDKGWTTSSINRWFKKFRDMGTVDRRQGSGRLRSARADENIKHVHFLEVNKYASKKLVVVFITVFFFSAVKNRLRFHRIKDDKMKRVFYNSTV